MNVSFKTIRRSGDKVYILSEISGYDERLPVVLAASTESGARHPVGYLSLLRRGRPPGFAPGSF